MHRYNDPVTQQAAFFDLDKTVIAKSSTLAFGRPLYKAGFVGRRAWQSKMSGRIVAEAMVRVWWLRLGGS